VIEETYIKVSDLIPFLQDWGELKLHYGLNKIKHEIPYHGNCCCCQKCGQSYDDCVCSHNEWVEILTTKIQNYIKGRVMYPVNISEAKEVEFGKC